MTKFVVENGRILKAKKIESVVLDYYKIHTIENKRILDIGCGNGEIISYFEKNNNKIYAVDILNQLKPNLLIKNFHLTPNAKLPFKDNFFDIIISNHVVEHIQDQNTHMQEIYRCLKNEGVCYFATPNKNFIIEPHHKIPFIHYFKESIFHGILKKLGVYEEDLYLLSYKKMKKSFIKFNYTEYTAKILKNPNDFCFDVRIFKIIPLRLLLWSQPILQSNIFILKKV